MTNNIIVTAFAHTMEAIEMSRVLPVAHLLGLNNNLALLGCLVAFLGLALMAFGAVCVSVLRKHDAYFFGFFAAGFACILAPLGVKLLNDTLNLW